MPGDNGEIRATSATRAAIGPTVSKYCETATEPLHEIRPIVGRNPATPQKEAGMRMEPPVSEPIEPWHIPAARVAPEPPLEPPGMRLTSQGLRTGP